MGREVTVAESALSHKREGKSEEGGRERESIQEPRSRSFEEQEGTPLCSASIFQIFSLIVGFV